MSINGTFELTVTVDSFKNVDLFHQGMYFIKISIHTEGKNPQYATPIMTAVGTSEEEMRGLPQHKPAHILDYENAFCTRTFLIRYCEEEVALGDVGHFRLNMDATKLSKDGPAFGAVIIELDLMYASHKKASQSEAKEVEFTSVSKHLFRCFKVAHGVYQYCPVTFDEWHFCYVDVAIHIVLLNIEFRRPRKEKAVEEKPKSGAMAFFGKLLQKAPPPPPPESLEELILRNMPQQNGKVNMKEFASQVNFYQRAFTAPLINAHNQLSGMFLALKPQEHEFNPYLAGMLDVEHLDIPGMATDGSVGLLSQRMAEPLNHTNVAAVLQKETSHLGDRKSVV